MQGAEGKDIIEKVPVPDLAPVIEMTVTAFEETVRKNGHGKAKKQIKECLEGKMHELMAFHGMLA
jgi:hypothetical protein